MRDKMKRKEVLKFIKRTMQRVELTRLKQV